MVVTELTRIDERRPDGKCNLVLSTEPWVTCPNPAFKQGTLCIDHGCQICGNIVLADTEDTDLPRCYEHYHGQ